MRRAVAVAVALAALTSLASCSDDSASGTDPVEVEVGKAFQWNDFAVEDGWTIKPVKRTVDLQEVTTPEISGTIVNESDKERATIFQLVFSADGDEITTVICSAATMAEGQSMQFLCPGLSSTMPEDYDAVVVQEYTR